MSGTARSGLTADETGPVARQAGEFVINRQTNGTNMGGDQYNSCVQERESFLSTVAATKTKATWIVWLGVAMVMAAFVLALAAMLPFVQIFRAAFSTRVPPVNVPSPFGVEFLEFP